LHIAETGGWYSSPVLGPEFADGILRAMSRNPSLPQCGLICANDISTQSQRGQEKLSLDDSLPYASPRLRGW
jgi:hypothetical protein